MMRAVRAAGPVATAVAALTAAGALAAALFAGAAQSQSTPSGAARSETTAPLSLKAEDVPPPPDCGSVVLVKCDKPESGGVQVVTPQEALKRERARRLEARRTGQLTFEMERIIIEGEGERETPEAIIGRALSRPLVRSGENSFSVGESAQCTCMNVCPPWPFPCCECTAQPGARPAHSPGWKPTN